MIRKCIAKLNSLIQWTKKFSFMHLYIIFFIPLNLCCLLSIFEIPSLLRGEGSEGLATSGLIGVLYHIVNICLTASITILIKIITIIFKKKFVIDKFFLENSKYNIFYIISWILIILPIIYLILDS